MEIRVLQYFLAVAREQTISAAAEQLHLTQPTLSRQLKDLEDELGKKLFHRGNHKITLTEEGMLLRQRAEQIVELVRKTENEITNSSETLAGDIYIGAGETDAVRLIAKTASKMQKEYPLVHFHIYSGDSPDITDRLDKGLIDFGIVFEPTDVSKYEVIPMTIEDIWGVLMRKDSELAEKSTVSPQDLWDKPLIISRQQTDSSAMVRWLGKKLSELKISATYNLVYNASLMVDEGIGYAITLDKLINVSGDSNLCFRPFEPTLSAKMNFVWNKYAMMTKAAEEFLNRFKAEIQKLDSV